MVENSTLRSGGVEQPQQQQPSVPEPQQQQQIKKEEPLWYRLGFRSCRMPEFYDPSRHRYDLTNMDASGDAWIDAGWGRRHQLKVQAQQQQNEPIEDNTNEYYQMMLRKDQPHSPFQNLAIARNISFVHVGKAGGSTLGCHLAESRRYVHKHCAPEILKRPAPLSALSLHVNCYTHWQGHMYCYNDDGTTHNKDENRQSSNSNNNNNQNAFLVNIRHPIDRMASWFLYEHALNHKVNYAERGYHCGDLMLFSCFETWDDLVTRGLQPLGRNSDNNNNKLRIGSHLTQDQCSHWARAAVQGAVPASYHNYYNYDWYAHHMFGGGDDREDGTSSYNKEVFVIRAEHLQQDWIEINRILSGDSESTSNASFFPASLQEHQNAAQHKALPVFNKTASREGITNLCRALCEEIQIYKRLLQRAVNLQAQDWEISLRELRDVCPDETSLDPHSCHDDES